MNDWNQARTLLTRLPGFEPWVAVLTRVRAGPSVDPAR